METVEPGALVVHCAENLPCEYDREIRLGLLEGVDGELQEELDSYRQTVADVIERRNVVEFSESCFPELAGWDTDPDDQS